MFNLETFEEILECYPEIQEEVTIVANEREKERLKRINQKDYLEIA
jgi:hypothetical protein